MFALWLALAALAFPPRDAAPLDDQDPAICVTTEATLALRVRSATTGQPLEAPVATAASGITNISTFLEKCPTTDPAFAQITADFEIRRDGVKVTTPPCTEPVSLMATSAWTDELIVLQGLRVMYYMDRGMTGHLPWTSGTLYDWMKSRVRGVNLAGGSYCCPQFDGKPFIAVGKQNDFSRDFDRRWRGISGNIDLYAHETRHYDGFPHVSCCGLTNGCDETFDTTNLSPYGVQWWLNKLWLDGTINVGLRCGTNQQISDATSWYVSGLNFQYGTRFCQTRPAAVTAPPLPGGPCMIRRHPIRR